MLPYIKKHSNSCKFTKNKHFTSNLSKPPIKYTKKSAIHNPIQRITYLFNFRRISKQITWRSKSEIFQSRSVIWSADVVADFCSLQRSRCDFLCSLSNSKRQTKSTISQMCISTIYFLHFYLICFCFAFCKQQQFDPNCAKLICSFS